MNNRNGIIVDKLKRRVNYYYEIHPQNSVYPLVHKMRYLREEYEAKRLNNRLFLLLAAICRVFLIEISILILSLNMRSVDGTGRMS